MLSGGRAPSLPSARLFLSLILLTFPCGSSPPLPPRTHSCSIVLLVLVPYLLTYMQGRLNARPPSSSFFLFLLRLGIFLPGPATNHPQIPVLMGNRIPQSFYDSKASWGMTRPFLPPLRSLNVGTSFLSY
ncbi:hypothetical protein M440DRAFT_1400288, partial [Trichoderma longibrachiatum ATCC 18648]